MSEHEGKCVTPDVTGSRYMNGLVAGVLRLDDCLPLLRTCQQVHEEATSILYGTNVFHFNDQPHGIDKYKDVGFGITLPWCDFVTMYGFLGSIESGNRTKIRHLQLNFTTVNYILCPHEGIKTGPFIWRPGGGANLVCDALELLSVKHGLSTLEISFVGGSIGGMVEFQSLFLDIPRKLRNSLELFRDIKEVKSMKVDREALEKEPEPYRTWYINMYQKTQPKFELLKAKMEAESRDKRKAREDKLLGKQSSQHHVVYDTPCEFESDPIDQTGNTE